MFTKTALQQEEVQVSTISQLNHIEHREGKETLDSIVYVFCTDCEEVAEGIAGWMAQRTGR